MLKNNRCSANLLSDYTRSSVGGEVASIAGSIDFTGGEEDHRRARTFPVRGIVVVELLEGAKIRIAVVDELGEGGVAAAWDILPVSTGNEMPAVAAPFVVIPTSVAVSVVAPEVVLAGDESGAGEN